MISGQDIYSGIQNVSQQGVFEVKSYALPASPQIATRLQENLKRFGSNYVQFTFVILLLGGLTNLTFLAVLAASCALWYFLNKNESSFDLVPDFGVLTTDKKKVVLFLINILLLYIICGQSIFTYIGCGFMLSFIHAFLFISPSTPKDVSDTILPQQSAYQNFEMSKQ
ncbi:hypothetical protein pb186bvf_017451 [Paramecium bursaria]